MTGYPIRLPGLVLLLSALLALPAAGEGYPSRVVTLVVPYPAGGPTDQLARQLAPHLSEKLGQGFIVENVSGGATTIATGRVTRAAPDGHMLLVHNLQIAANVALHPSLPFDTEKDLVALAFINHNPLVLVGRRSLPANTLAELIASMRTAPLKMAHPGTGSTGHLTTALFAQEARVAIDHIPYRGAAPALQDVIGDHIDLFFATPQSVVEAVPAGQVKAFGITTKEPSRQFPNVTPMAQALGPNLEISYWHALFAPAATPRPILDKLAAVLQEIMEDPALIRIWADAGVTPYPKELRAPATAQALLASEVARWGAVVRANNIQPPAQ